MANNETLQSVRALLREGNTAQALQLVIGLLEKDSRFRDNLLRTLRVAEVNYNSVRQQELKGILSFQEAQREYSKITDTLLAVLDDFEAGRVPPTSLPATGQNRWKLWAIVGGGVLVLGALVFWWIQRGKAGCPDFEAPNTLHVMVLPFDKLGGVDKKPALLIQSSIQELTKKANIPAEVRLNTREEMRGLNSQDAEKLGRKCDADLVIFGQYQSFEKDSIRVKMGFKFLKGGGTEFVGPFKTFRDITAVQPERDLQDAVFSLCAMIAVNKKNWGFAKRWMGRIREKNAEELAMANWLEKQTQ